VSYIRCDNKKCNFEQDDFWELYFKPKNIKSIFKYSDFRSVFGYNPVSCFLGDLFENLIPRWIRFDESFVVDSKKFGYFLRVRWYSEEPIKAEKTHMTRETILYTDSNPQVFYDIHSWSLIIYHFQRMIRKFRNMKWWTKKSWLNDKNPICPKCGNKYFVED
jgi:hypothetical protein